MTNVAVAVVHRNGQFLVGQRPDDSSLAGYWEFPGGKVEADESFEQAAVRECREETGVGIVVVGAYGDVAHRYDDHESAKEQPEPIDLAIRFLACQPVDSRAEPRPPFRWATVAELAQLRFPAANQNLIRQLLAQAGAVPLKP